MEQKAIFGDFQTPTALAEAICKRLHAIGVAPVHVIEPTCGVGAFLFAAAAHWPKAVLEGFEVNPTHLAQAQRSASQISLPTRMQLSQQDFFTHDWQAHLSSCPENTLLLGNPPWITNTALSAANGVNLPDKTNFQALKGLSAKTGKANFDIAEWMMIRLIEAAGRRAFTVAMLCKTATARKVLRDGWLRTRNVSNAQIYPIDAAEWFGVSVGACLLVLKTGRPDAGMAIVHENLDGTGIQKIIGLAGNELVSDLLTYQQLRHLDGYSPFVWRSGIKHDCADVMELKEHAVGQFVNGLGELVEIEDQLIYPLLKSTDVARGRLTSKRAVIVPQHAMGDDTTTLQFSAPSGWQYLCAHGERMASRKSSIYKNRPPFSVFGIGAYSFKPWKIAVSALHRDIQFRLIEPQRDKPVFFDDTCYFLGFASREQAQTVLTILQSDLCKRFMATLSFSDAKRTVTADLLQRLNLGAIAKAAGLPDIWDEASQTTPSQTYSSASPVQAVLMMEPQAEYPR